MSDFNAQLIGFYYQPANSIDKVIDGKTLRLKVAVEHLWWAFGQNFLKLPRLWRVYFEVDSEGNETLVTNHKLTGQKPALIVDEKGDERLLDNNTLIDPDTGEIAREGIGEFDFMMQLSIASVLPDMSDMTKEEIITLLSDTSMSSRVICLIQENIDTMFDRGNIQ